MTPRLPVAVNLAQLEALLSQSRFSLRKRSLVVPKCISPLAATVALWAMEFLPVSYTNRTRIKIAPVKKADLKTCRNFKRPKTELYRTIQDSRNLP